MSNPSTPPANTARPADPRAAARAAALARFAPPPAPDAGAEPGPGPAAAGAAAPAGGYRATGTAIETKPRPEQLFARENSWQPSEKEERDTRIKFSRLLDRGLVRDNGYKQVAEGVETLLSIARNIQNSNDPKYRDLKENNKTLQNKVLSLKGGHDYLIALGFRVATVDFVKHYLFQNSVKSSWELGIGAETLAEHLSSLQERATNATLSAQAHKSAEASRVAAALAQIEADRDAVRNRTARDRVMRTREDRLAREAAEKEERARMAREVEAEQAERAERARMDRLRGGGMMGSASMPGTGASGGQMLGGGVSGMTGGSGASASGSGMDGNWSDGAADDLLDQEEEDEQEEQAQLMGGHAPGHGHGHGHGHGQGQGHENEEDSEDEEYAAHGHQSWGQGRRLDE